MKAKVRIETDAQNHIFIRRLPLTGYFHILPILWIFSFCSIIQANGAGTIKGTVRAVAGLAANAQSSLISGARITLVNHATPKQPINTVSSASGDFIFENLPSGEYTLTVSADGLTSVVKEITLTSGALLTLEIDLSATINESVTIRDEEGLLSTSETATSNVVRTETLKSQPLRSDSYQNAIQLTPGAVRDGYGNNYLKGARTGQNSYTVNGADVTDPGTGNLAFDIPLEAAQSVQIEENPYSAEFGRFTGGVTNLQTKGGGDKVKVSLARFFPTFHNIFSTQIDSFRPRITVSGPVVAKRVFFLQSFEYRFYRTFVPNLLKPDNNTILEGFNSFTQIDWNINKENVLKFNVAIFPQKIRNLGLDTFNPVAVTPNYKQRGILLSVSEQSVFKNASFVSSEISYKPFNVDTFAKSNLPFTIQPESNSGGYFADTRRRTKRVQWQEIYYLRPMTFYGQHSIKAGFEFDHTSVGGQIRYNSIFIRRTDNTLAQRIDFTNAAPIDFGYNEAAGFVQDRWVVDPKLTLDYGLRIDRDGITNRTNFAPRFSFLFQPFKGGRTMLRGGAGIFFDRSLASAGYVDREAGDDFTTTNVVPDSVPNRIVTDYSADGTTMIGSPRLFDTRIGDRLHTPRSVRWSLQLDHAITKDWIGRIGYLQRFTKNDLLIDPIIEPGSTGTLLLTSRGRSRYDEFQLLLTYNKKKFGQWNTSYVFSRSRGDMNTSDKFFGDTPAFVVRPNEYGRLPFDTPHRFLAYGEIEISNKHDISIAPILELRSGFPYSKLNERLDFVGRQNAAGRFPAYLSFDLQVTKGIRIPFFKDKRARIGVVFFNITNHFNPRDMQMNITSPNYGRFYNSLGTAVKGKFDIDF